MKRIRLLGVATAFGIVVALVGAPAAFARNLVDVDATSLIATTSPGSAGEVDCTVRNRTSRATIDTVWVGTITYADGSTDAIFGPFTPPPLAPGAGFSLTNLFFVPEGTATGTATFTCSVEATLSAGKGKLGQTESDVATSTFDVVPARDD